MLRTVYAPAKPKEKKFITRFVIDHQEAIGIQDLLFDAPAKCSPAKPVKAPCAYASIVVHQLLHSLSASLRDAPRNFRNVAGTSFSVMPLVRTIPVAFPANH